MKMDDDAASTTADSKQAESEAQPQQQSQPQSQPVGRKFASEDTSNARWKTHKKHFFILSQSGKPIYSRYGDEVSLSPFMASLTAMTAFVTDLHPGDHLRYLRTGDRLFVFSVAGPLILVCVTSTGEPVDRLVQQLNYLHLQILSLLTRGVEQIFARRAQFDLRNLLGGADRFLDSLCSMMDHDPSLFLNAIHCLRLPHTKRDVIARAMQQAGQDDLLYAICLAKDKLVSLIRPKRYILQPADLHLLLNFINASAVFRAGESWTPVCLPKFNDSGFLHAYICYVAEDVCLLLISVKQEVFHELQKCKERIVSTLLQHSEKPLEAVQLAIREETPFPSSASTLGASATSTPASAFTSPSASIRTQRHPIDTRQSNDDEEVTQAGPFVPTWTAWSSYGVSELNIPPLRHFIYKAKATCQITHPRFEAPYTSRKEQKRLFRLYQMVHRRVHRFKKAHKVYYQVSEHESTIAWTTAGFELFAVFSPTEDKEACIDSCNAVLKWVKQEENSLFILNSPVWS